MSGTFDVITSSSSKSLWRASQTRKEYPVTFRDALEPGDICPFQARVNESLSLVVVSWHVVVLRATHCDRLCGTPRAINLIAVGLSNLMRIGGVKRHTHILSISCQLKDTNSELDNFLAPTQLRGIDSDKQRLDAALFCVLHNTLRYGAILVDVSFRV